MDLLFHCRGFRVISNGAIVKPSLAQGGGKIRDGGCAPPQLAMLSGFEPVICRLPGATSCGIPCLSLNPLTLSRLGTGAVCGVIKGAVALWLDSQEVFPWLGCHNPGPAVDATFFEEILRMLAGVFDLIEIGLG